MYEKEPYIDGTGGRPGGLFCKHIRDVHSNPPTPSKQLAICDLFLHRQRGKTQKLRARVSQKMSPVHHRSCYSPYNIPCSGYLILYNKLISARILIVSQLWSVKGQAHRWRQRTIEVWQLRYFSEPVRMRWFVEQLMNYHHLVPRH